MKLADRGISAAALAAGIYRIRDTSLSGDLLVRAAKKDCVVVAEVNLSEQYFWRANMGEFKGRLRHERPAVELPK